jgi:DNA-binding MarR family transcriptional regulator
MNQVLNVSNVEKLRSTLSRSSAAPGEHTLDMQASAASLLAELRATCDRLFAKFGETKSPGEDSPPVHPTELRRASPDDFTAARFKQLLRMRARRRSRSNDELFEWPAWDMLLDLAAVRAEGGHVSVSAVCISSGAPQSTALRKLAALEGAQLVRRYSHGTDRRRVCITLSDEALDMVNSALREEAAFFQGIG